MIPQRLTVVRALLLLITALLTASVAGQWHLPVDLVLLPVVAVALRSGSAAGALMGLAAGLVVALVPPGSEPLGMDALAYAAVGAGVGLLERNLRMSVLLPVAAVVLAESALQVARAALLLGAGLPPVPLRAGLCVLVTGVVGAAAIPMLLRLERWYVHRGMA